ncbi:pentapeptide repeat-containing protein [Spongiactinospora sp. 9N601]|uniref:pentapeptide repeat-containing protein n=1 Tax=Spongiactinospora sp. 9N601 TaxID=3375149 RepID=UPI00379B5E0B
MQVLLPAVEEEFLTPTNSLDVGKEGKLVEFAYTGSGLRQLSLNDVALSTGRIAGLRAQRVVFRGLRLASIEFVDCELSELRWSDSKLSRVRFTNCKFLGAVFDDVTLDDVLFERCRLDYATFISRPTSKRGRAAGSLIFTECSLHEATFTGVDLGGTLFDGCDLRRTEFVGGHMRGCDLRGQDLSAIRGTSSLSGVTIERSQVHQLGEALAAELDVTYGEDA